LALPPTELEIVVQLSKSVAHIFILRTTMAMPQGSKSRSVDIK